MCLHAKAYALGMTLSESDRWATLIAELPGGQELVRWCGEAPLFHDGYVLGLHLNRSGQSTLTVHYWKELIPDPKFNKNVYVSSGDFIAQFHIDGIIDCNLTGFNSSNIILTLRIVQAPIRTDRQPWVDPSASVEDLEIQIETSFGLDGYIRAKRISVDFQIGKPIE